MSEPPSWPQSRSGTPRWQRCVDHRGTDVRDFAAGHFSERGRSILLLAGAGFDPRSLAICNMLAQVSRCPITGLFFRERRPNPNLTHLAAAERHVSKLRELVTSATFVDLEVFEEDGAVGVGRRIVEAVRSIHLHQYSDIIVDFSALSIGASFPVTRYIVEALDASEGSTNLHAMVTARPATDDRIVPSPSAVVGPVHGFRGRFGLHETAQAARLWMPQLRFGQSGILEQLYDFVSPDDVVPVLPFPSNDPRIGDRLIEHYSVEFESRWAVDARSIVYADERSPLDFYRTVLRIDDGRAPVFEETGGSLLLLSPIGSKVLGIGAMMAAMERDLPVVYVEALSYATNLEQDDSEFSERDFVHIWLAGPEVYPRQSTN